MSDNIEHPSAEPAAVHSRGGQAMVELALLLPLLLVLLLGAIDFGRAYFGWIAVTNASRVAANYAATHPDAWALGNDAQQDEYIQLIRDAGADNCGLYESDEPPPPAFPDGSRELGDRVRVDLTCEFEMVNPFIEPLIGPFTLSASSTFNVRRGCTDCLGAPAGPPPPIENFCRQVPTLVGLSVAGAILAWEAAGFTGPVEPLGAEATQTVASQTVDQGEATGCSSGWAFFSSSVMLTFAFSEPDGDACDVIPNILGMAVADGRSAWTAAGFLADQFIPETGEDEQIVNVATYTPSTAGPGQCVVPDEISVEVQYEAPPPAPPSPPCKVPSFVNEISRTDAPGAWSTAGFATTILFQPPASNWTVVGRQSLLGGSYAVCESEITLSK
jgi:hypothetical protein